MDVDMVNKRKKEGYVDLNKVGGKDSGEKMAEELESNTPDENEKKTETKPKRKKSRAKVKTHLETNIDRLYELVRKKGFVKVAEVSKELGIDKDQIEEWGRILEDHKLLKLHYPPVGDPVFVLKKFKSDTKEVKKLKGRKRLKAGKKAFLINLVILFGFIGFVAYYTRIIPLRFPQVDSFFIEISNILKTPTIRISYVEAYLGVIIIIIIVVALILIVRRWRRK